jgi:hypothetical protein
VKKRRGGGPALLHRRPVQLKAVADAWSRSRSRELPFTMEPEPDQPRATPPLSTTSSPPLHRAELPASSSPCCSPPRWNAKERGCCTREMSLWKPWTAPPYFLCSRPFHAARSTTSSSRPEREVSTKALPCCGPGLRAEAGPSHVSSLLVCCPLSRTAPPCRPAVA